MLLRQLTPPVYNASTVLFDDYEAFDSSTYTGITYGTRRLPTLRVFEEAVKELEGGEVARTFQSGLSAITNTLLAFTKAGDHILMCENVYAYTAGFCNDILSKYNIETTYVPANVGADIAQYIKPNTKIIFLESPGSNTFEIQDIPAIVAVAQDKNIMTIMDNTWATPLHLKPLGMGVDISTHSVSKYIGGHSDLLLGVATVNKKHSEVFTHFYKTLEIFASP